MKIAFALVSCAFAAAIFADVCPNPSYLIADGVFITPRGWELEAKVGSNGGYQFIKAILQEEKVKCIYKTRDKQLALQLKSTRRYAPDTKKSKWKVGPSAICDGTEIFDCHFKKLDKMTLEDL